MKTVRRFCVTHETPLIPDSAFDFAIGMGDYRPTRGLHISQLDTFWDRMRPYAYGAAGNYVIPRAMDLLTPPADLIAVFSHRKVVSQLKLGQEAASYAAFREISSKQAESLPSDSLRPFGELEFLVGMPIKFPQGIVHQYAEKHRAIDLYEYLSLAAEVGVLSAELIQDFSMETVFIPGGCELGIYPSDWLYPTLRKLGNLGRVFLSRSLERLQTYDSYQVRAVGFLAERLGSFLLLRELQRRYSEGLPRELFGSIYVITASGTPYTRAVATLSAQA